MMLIEAAHQSSNNSGGAGWVFGAAVVTFLFMKARKKIKKIKK